MTKEDNPEIGRLLASKDHDYPFFYDGESFVTLNRLVSLDSLRCDGDYFHCPVFIDSNQIKRLAPIIEDSSLLWTRFSLEELEKEVFLLTSEELKKL